jgi:hypothetical protein
LERRKLKAAIGLLAAGTFLVGGCGGTLEGKYRRGQLTTTSTTGRTAGNGTSPNTNTTTTTTTTTPTAGNAAGQGAQGAASGSEVRGTISRSATRRTVVPPSGGRHR